MAGLLQIYIPDKSRGNLSRLKYTVDEMCARKGGLSRVGMFYLNKYNIPFGYQQ
jgi:hypothetical protein